MSIVKRQHYVWREYLRPWAENDIIWTKLIEQEKILRIKLMGVAQERYFYKLEDFSEGEENFLREYINKTSPNAVKELNLDFLKLFTSTSNLKKQLDKTINPEIEKEKYTKEIRRLEINLMETAHGKIENLGHKLINCRSIDDLKAIEQDDYIFDAIMFLCFQYFRTKSMRKSILKSFEGGEYEDLAEKSWNILSYAMSTTLAKSISLDPKLRFIFHEIRTTDSFLTSDQPIFNILNDQLNEENEVINLEFYYPISTKHALTIHFRDDQNEKYVENISDSEQVKYYNEKVVANSDFYVFANTKEMLDNIGEF